jgi:hypothetical protein
MHPGLVALVVPDYDPAIRFFAAAPRREPTARSPCSGISRAIGGISSARGEQAQIVVRAG